MPFDLENAKAYVNAISLKGLPRSVVAQSADEDAGEVFDAAKTQARVVGAGVFSFATGVTPQVREAISDSALLAQLSADKRTKSTTDPLEWFTVYSEVLNHVGWVLQDQQMVDYTKTGTTAEVHEKIIEVITAALAPTPAALAIIAASINALKAMKPGSSWLTIFSRDSQRATMSRFQVGLVETDPAGQVWVSLLGCLIEAEDTVTQALLFKFRSSKATFKARTGKVSINASSLTDLGPIIRAKTRTYQSDYLSSILDI